jgi:hypothetical protein
MKKRIICCLLSFLILQLSCSKQSMMTPLVSIVVGDAKLNRNGNEQALIDGKYLKAQDNLLLSEKSKVKLTIAESRSVYLNKGTILEIGSITDGQVEFVLKSGELHIAQIDSQNRAISILTPSGTINSSNADVNISFDAQKNYTSVTTLRGEVNVSSGGKLTVVPPCSKFLFSEGQINGPLQIADSDIAGLESWVGKSTIDLPVEEIGCRNQTPVSIVKNLPPEWKKMPQEICDAGKAFTDTVQAVDPENGSISYSIVNGPEEIKINNDGIITYKGLKAGTYQIRLRAIDDDSLSTDTEYVLIAKGKDEKPVPVVKEMVVKSSPSAILNADQNLVPAGKEIEFDAGKSNDSLDNQDNLSVRWDFDGDGTWDFPSGNGFSKEKKIKHSFQTAGTYNTVVEVKNSHGLSGTASVQVVVTKGIAIESINGPDTAHVGENVSFECAVVNPEYPVVNFDWSTDGDSLYEVHSKTPVIKHQYKKEGIFIVYCRASDEKGQSATKQKQIIIVNSKSYVEAGGPYKTFVNSSCGFEGRAKDADSKIVNYSWDFNGDGKAECSSATGSKTQYKFTKAGIYKVLFTITTDDKQKTSDSAIVTVVNRPPIAKACETIVSSPGKKVKLSGTGVDPDSGKVIYRWDFDGDGKIDWTSESSGTVVHRFDKYSNAVFSVVDADSAKASDTVRIVICPEEMATIEKGKYCIDKYEYPGKKGTIPEVNVTYEEAADICAKSGKRLCTEQEWQTACRGDEKGKWNYPYGSRFEVQRCNNVGNPYFNNKPSASGYYETCVNPKGVYDMSGNVAEWTLAAGKNNPYVYGGSWQNGENETKCSSKVQLQKGRKYFYAGFRCCK